MPVRSMQILLFLISSIILTEAVKPPGYVKPPETPDENPPKYEYGYNIEDEKGAAQGKSEQRDGIYALGGYYVQGSDSKQNVQYFADDWGYHPYVEYSNKGPHSSARAQLAIGAEAIKLKNNEIPAKDQVAENINRQQKAPVLQPQVLQPQVVQPQVLQSQVVQPQVVQPQVLQPQVIQHQVLQPQLQQPELQQAQVQQPVLLQNEVLPAVQQPQQILIPQQHTQQFVLQPQEQQQILLPELLPTPQQLISQNQGHLSEQLQQQPQLLQQQPQLLQQQPQLLLQPTGAEQTQQVIIQHNQQEQQQEQQQQQLQQQQLQQQVILTQEQQQPQQIIYEQPQQLLINQQVDNSVQEKNVQISQQIIHENVNNQFELEQLTAGNYGNKIITNAPKLIETTKNLVSGQDVININEAYSQKQDASLETSTIKSIVSEYAPTISTVLSNVQINHDGDSSTPAPVTELSLDKEPIIVPDYEDNQIKSTTIRTEEVYSTTGATLQTQQYEATAAPDVIVTPRPLGASFLAPITAGVQLQNVEQKTVNINTSPQHFLVEVQKSVPFYLGKYEYIHNPEVYTEQQISINQTVSAEQKAVENINLGNTLLYFPVEQKPKAEALVQELPQVQINQQFHQAELNVQQPPSTIIEHNFLNKVEQTESESKAVAVETEQRQILHSDIQAEAEIATQEKQTLQHHIQQTVPLVQVVEKPVPYPVVQTKFVEKPIEITKFVNQPYPVEVPVHIPVHVPYPVEKKVPYPVQVEKIVEKPVHITKIVEKPIHIPQPYPVQKIVEKPVEVLKYVDRPYPVHVRVPQPYPVEKLVKIPIQVPVEKIVEKPVPVPQYIEKIVEKPVTKYIDRPYPVQVPVQVQPLQYGQKQILQVNQGYQLPYLQNLHQILLDTRYQQQVPFKYTKTVQQLGNREQYSQQSQQQQQAVLFANPYLYAPTHIKQYLPPKQEINVGKGFAQQQLINGYLPPKPDCEQQSVALRNLYFTIKPDDYIGLLPPKQGSRHVKYARKLRTPRSNLKNLRLEYGFMPPLVPSLEIDENGHPIEKDEKN